MSICADYNGSNRFVGNASNIRVVKGTALYTTTFTPSRSPFTAVTGTSLLLNTDNGAGFLTDSSTNNFTVTNTGTVVTSSMAPGPDTAAVFYRENNEYDITLLPTQFDNNDIIDNPNVGGLTLGRPWIVGDTNPIEQDLILFFDTARTDCYSGAGTTIRNLVDNTASTLVGNVTFASNLLRFNNNTVTGQAANTANIRVQTVTNFRTLSLWYKQISAGTAAPSNLRSRYVLDLRLGVNGWIYQGSGSGDEVGGALASSTMYVSGGAAQPVQWLEQVGVWRNLTIVTDVPMTCAPHIFSRYVENEGMDVEFGALMMYSRAITQEENKHNYDEFKTRYGL
jgi:hypothetical protein